MPDLGHYRPAANSANSAGPSYTFHSEDGPAGLQHQAARPKKLSYVDTTATANCSNQRTTLPVTVQQLQLHKQASVPCLKPLPSVPKDVDADEDFDVDGIELVRPSPLTTPYGDNDIHIESDISSASASSAASSAASSSMDTNWHETSLRNQVAKLHIQYTDVDLAQTEAPSVFGLRRRIVAAALDHVAHHRPQDADVEASGSSSRQFDERGMSTWLSVQQSNSQRKGNILRKKISFGKKHARAAVAGQIPAHDPMPNGVAVSEHRSRSSSATTGGTGPHDKMLKRDKELAEREVDFDLVVLSRFETAELKMTVYTEHRQGSWVIKGPAPQGTTVLDEPPLVYSPWDCQIDSRAIVERKKLRSFIELSDTTCNIRCATCSSRSDSLRHEAHRVASQAFVACRQCEGSGAVQTTYVVCVTLRQSTFLPLNMPVRHRAGKLQAAFRSYLPKTTAAMSHVDVLRMRSLEAVRSCALRVGRAHYREHDARLLMAKAVLERRSCSSVAVINRNNGVFRMFDVTDGGCIRGGAGLIEEDSRIVEVPEIAEALSRLPVTTLVHPEATYRFVDLELVDMASSKTLSFVAESRSPSVYSYGASTRDSYSPSAFSFLQRNGDGGSGSTSRDSNTVRGVQRHAHGRSQTAAASGSISTSGSTASSLSSFSSAGPVAPSKASGSVASTLSGTSASVSSRTVQSWETAASGSKDHTRSR
ncbi:hypothetical protein EX895_003493 [Sporisorium graminicola]|uniref:Uncharacterized protein n=1 Tax=Sporisorium graminicola TaxID=280036 RepID=A0A4V6EU04_9BASI|nr:hypothetical protein EX895_003493 [Sporisorium graminicola]TKY87479.1 hypothetical protein EX895_003493 [Sporisorium graminicola]